MKTTCEPNLRENIEVCPLCGQPLPYPRALRPWDFECEGCRCVPWCRVTEQDGAVNLTLLPGRPPDSDDISSFVTTHVRSAGTKTVCCDLAAFETLSSLLIARLVILQKAVQAAAHRLVLCGVGPLVREEFAILRLDRFFEMMLDQAQTARECEFAAC